MKKKIPILFYSLSGAVCAGVLLLPAPVCAQTNDSNGVSLTTLHSFDVDDGEGPSAGLVEGSDGYFYGTTSWGGTNDGKGTVFKIGKDGAFTSLHTFQGGDGKVLFARLVEGGDGYFYGTTAEGGTKQLGTVFKISSTGEFTSLHSFTGLDGSEPDTGLTLGSDGDFYGTTPFGGATFIGGPNPYCGNVFKISGPGPLTSLYSFTGSIDGAGPGGLTLGSDGYFYGTAGGGFSNRGMVFKISPDGTFANLYSFTVGNDGAYPYGGLVQGRDGYFYGTTSLGPSTNSDDGGYGTVFKIGPDGTFTSLYSFTGGNDGANPTGGLVQGSDGYFYGTTARGGTSSNPNGFVGFGTVFKISPDGTFTSLYSFIGGNDGGDPNGGLVQGHDGYFYGTTAVGGTGHAGTVVRLAVPLKHRFHEPHGRYDYPGERVGP